MASKPPKPGARQMCPTTAQSRAREELRTLSAAWNNLTEEQRVAWDAEARTNRRGGHAARSRRRSGRRLFVKVNSRRLALGLDLLTWPPGPESCKPTPLVRLVITNRGGRIALKVRVSHGSAEGVMVSTWHPLRPGVMVWKKFVRLVPIACPAQRAERHHPALCREVRPAPRWYESLHPHPTDERLHGQHLPGNQCDRSRRVERVRRGKSAVNHSETRAKP